MNTPTNTDDVFDMRDVTARYEELEDTDRDESEEIEFKQLADLIEETKGNGGDHDWRGDWYPCTMIRDSYFEDYAQELAEDIGAIKDNAQWPYTCIDWKAAARDLRMDYTSCEFDGVTYWYR